VTKRFPSSGYFNSAYGGLLGLFMALEPSSSFCEVRMLLEWERIEAHWRFSNLIRRTGAGN
jgi:hypothetical protein